MILADRRMGESISEAVQRDSPVIAKARIEESNAIRDRELAARLGGIQVPKRTALEDFVEPELDEDLGRRLRRLNVLDVYAFEDDETTNKASSSKCSGGGSKASGPKKECVACQEGKPVFETLTAPCQHTYCRCCILQLFEAATTDESLFPPRCCRQTIPLDLVKVFLTKTTVVRFEAKAIEYKTQNRTYCSQQTCSAFIPATYICGEVAMCPDCHHTTCTVCKSASHKGDCPNDSALQSLIDTATANGWQRCYSCRRLVELELGCNHMTYVSSVPNSCASTDGQCSCVCRAEFCYICGQRWKTCQCPQWNEDRLIARANQIVRRDNPHNVANQQQVQRAADNLRERHECTHQTWRYVRGPHMCEECYHHLPQYIFECRQCRIQACNRCRMNRL